VLSAAPAVHALSGLNREMGSSSTTRTLSATLISLLLLCSGPAANAGPTLLKFLKLIDGTGEVLDGREIVVEKGLIIAVGSDLSTMYPNATKVILDDLYAMPGLVDVHVHLTYGLSGPSKGDAWKELFATTAPERLIAAMRNAKSTLQTGVTTVRDLFAFEGVDFQLKALIDGDVIPGPRMFITGEAIHPITMPPHHEGDKRDLPQEFSRKVEQSIATGADWIKIFATTGSADDLNGDQIYFYPEIKAATDDAHAAGLRVAVHSYSQLAVSDALRAGVDSIEHPVGLDDKLLQQWTQSDAVYVPTIDHNRYYADHRGEYGYDEKVEAELREHVIKNIENLRRAHNAGVRVAMGSDAVMTMFGQNTRELEWFVEAGLTTSETLQAATINGALLLGQQNRLGRLQKGFAADIIALKSSPLEDIRALTRNVTWVMKGGQIVHQKEN
jgi:imidazolonepropionase-like amidohydrolase